MPNSDDQPRKLTFEQLFPTLMDREELEYHLDSDRPPYQARSQSRFDTPEFAIVFGDTLRRLLIFRGTRVALKRRGFQRDVKLIANATSEQCVQALQSSAAQPADLARANAEGLARNTQVPKELATALRQMLVSTKDVPLTDGYKRNLRHEGHNLNVTEGSLIVFATFNFADTYSPLLFRLVSDAQPDRDLDQIVCNLTDDAPDMPSLQRMHQLIAQSPRAQAKFWLLMDDLADIYLMGFDYSFIGRHHVRESFHHKYREDQLASTAIPALGGYGVAELEPFESQARGFQHGHRKKYAIPKMREHEVIKLFREKDSAELHSMLKDLEMALIRCAETVQYEASTLPAKQMNQNVLPEQFTKKQQQHSRLDGGLELDGTRRDLLATTETELPGHHVLERRLAAAEGRAPLSMYSQVSLRGCHQSLMPSYRLPQGLGGRKTLDEVGMWSATHSAEQPVLLPPTWAIDEDGDHVTGPLATVGAEHSDDPGSAARPASLEALLSDAGDFALSFCRDFRALHQFNHDHDCTSTCIKYVAKKCKEAAESALRKGKVVACRFFFFYIVVLMYVESVLTGGQTSHPAAAHSAEQPVTTKRFRRRGKKLVPNAYIATTNEHNEFCKVQLQRDTPFRSSSTDVGQNWGRCNVDLQFMPRTLVADEFFASSAEQPAVVQANPALALGMYGVRMKLPKAPLLRRCFHAMVAMFQAAHNCDFYITKYIGKPMEQLQSLLANIGVGLRRMEQEEEASRAASTETGSAAGPADADAAALPAERARRTTLRIATAANRSSWCSCCEMATFIKTGAMARKTHRPMAIFLSRPLFLYEECRRLLQHSHNVLMEPPKLSDEQMRPIDVLCFAAPLAESAVQREVPPTEDGDTPDRSSMDSSDDDDLSQDEDGSADAASAPSQDEDHNRSAELPAEQHPESAPQLPPAALPNQAAPSDASDEDETLIAGSFEVTTSAHDDWLHRGLFLFDFDFHTYMRYVRRKPCSARMKVTDIERAEDIFLFDSHYALAKSHCQELKTDGQCTLVVLEALKCPSPAVNNGEDNAVFKSLLGTLIKCQGPGHCADPLFCRSGFFQVTVPESSLQTATDALYQRSDGSTLTVKRVTHPDDSPSTFSCRLQWKARRAEIEVLAQQATNLSNDAKRIPVLADTHLLRGFHFSGAAQSLYHLFVCLTQMWIQKEGRALPPFAPLVLAYLGIPCHHAHQMSLAQFSAYHLRDVIYNLDMLSIARTTKLSTESKDKAEDEDLGESRENVANVETEFYGGETNGGEELEDEDPTDLGWTPRHRLQHDELVKILVRSAEVAAASRKGRKKASDLQMKSFDDHFHTVLNTPVPRNDARLGESMLWYYERCSAFALDYQD